MSQGYAAATLQTTTEHRDKQTDKKLDKYTGSGLPSQPLASCISSSSFSSLLSGLRGPEMQTDQCFVQIQEFDTRTCACSAVAGQEAMHTYMHLSNVNVMVVRILLFCW